MHEVIVALFALGIGVLFCFYGFKAMRLLFPLWGLVTGYWVGAAAIHAITGDSFFGTSLGILVGIATGLVFAVLAYLFYAVAVVVFTSMVGYWLGAGLLIAFGLRPGLLTFLVGLAVALVFATVGLATNLPKYLLLFLTAFFGAALVVSGVLLVANVVNLPALKDGVVALVTDQSWIWQLLWVVLGVFGYATQIARSAEEEIQWAAEWEAR